MSGAVERYVRPGRARSARPYLDGEMAASIPDDHPERVLAPRARMTAVSLLRVEGLKQPGAVESLVHSRILTHVIRPLGGRWWYRDHIEMVFTNPVLAGFPARRMTLPPAFALFDKLPIGPAQQGKIEVAPGDTADRFHHGRAVAFALLHLVGEQNH